MKNTTTLKLSDSLFFFSYKTLVAVLTNEGELLTTNKFFSNTTSKHINKFKQLNKKLIKAETKVTQSTFESFNIFLSM